MIFFFFLLFRVYIYIYMYILTGWNKIYKMFDFCISVKLLLLNSTCRTLLLKTTLGLSMLAEVRLSHFLFPQTPSEMWGQMITITTFVLKERYEGNGIYQGFVGEEGEIMWKEFLTNSDPLSHCWCLLIIPFLFLGGDRGRGRKFTSIFVNLFLIFVELLRFYALLTVAVKWLWWIFWKKLRQCHMYIEEWANIICYLWLVICPPV